MSRVLKVSNGDYRIQVQSASPSATSPAIILDTGSNTGTVVITGNLDVKGTTTTVESTNTTVADNIIQLNYGQTGNGISSALSYQAGIEVERGNYSAAQFVFNESVQHYNPATSTSVSGTFVVKTADNALSGLQVRTIANDGNQDLIFDLQGGNYVLRIANSTNYYARVTNANDIPNLQYLQNYVASSYAGAGQGIAIVNSLQYPLTGALSAANSAIQALSSSILFQISGTTISTLSSGGFSTGNVELTGNSVTNVSSNNLILTATNNNVEVSAFLNLDNQASTPSYVSNTTKLYSSATIGPGRTGVYVTNSTVQTPDELISRNRAVLLSILL
jgi:hypothetical protein